MTHDDIIRMAREVDADEHYVSETDDIPWSFEFSLTKLEEFAALVAAEKDAEIKALKADNERLRDELRQSSIDHTQAEVERLRAELVEANATRERCNERAFALEAEIERLRSLLADIRKDKQTLHWHESINAELELEQEPPR